MTDQSNLNVLGIIFLFAMVSALRPVAANEQDLQLILTGDAAALDRSTTFLANGYTKAAIRYAHRALRYDRSTVEDLVAHQNLCIAWTLEGDAASAEPHCHTVRDGPLPAEHLRPLKTGVYTLKFRGNAKDDYPPLSAIVDRNLAQIGTFAAGTVVVTSID